MLTFLHLDGANRACSVGFSRILAENKKKQINML